MTKGGECSKLDPSADAYANLQCIAELLDCSVEAFNNRAETPFELRGAAELVSLWAMIPGNDARSLLLDFAHKLAKL